MGPANVDALLRALQTNVESPGRYIRRLTLSFDPWSSSPSAADRLNSVLQKCHGLHVFEITGTQRDPPDLAIILDRVASVRHFGIIWNRDDDLSPTKSIPLFSDMSRLQSLESLNFYWCNNWGDFPRDKVAFPRLHTMDLGTQGADPKNVLDKIATEWELPALRSLSIHPAYNRESLTPILTAHGRDLTTVHLRAGFEAHHAVVFDLLSAFCPSVEEVSVRAILWSGDNSETGNDHVKIGYPVVLPHIRLLRVENLFGTQNSNAMDSFFRFIYNMTTPNLLSIQLKAFPTNYPRKVPALPTRWLPKIWGIWETEFLKKGIRFEDKSRKVIYPADVEFSDER
jgi:hypothetical protein